MGDKKKFVYAVDIKEFYRYHIEETDEFYYNRSRKTLHINSKTLLEACKKNKPGDVMPMLRHLDHEIKPFEIDDNGKNSLFYACENQMIEHVKRMVSKYPKLVLNIDMDGNNGLIMSIMYGINDLTNIILDKYSDKIDINHRNNDGRNALSYACVNGNNFIASRLINTFNIDIIQLKNEKSMLMLAIKNHMTEIIEILIKNKNKNKIDINFIDNDNNSALTAAFSMINDYEDATEIYICKILLNVKNININHIDNNGNTALIYACKYKNNTLATNLIKRKANPKQINIHNESAFNWACHNQMTDIITSMMTMYDKDILPFHRQDEMIKLLLEIDSEQLVINYIKKYKIINDTESILFNACLNNWSSLTQYMFNNDSFNEDTEFIYNYIHEDGSNMLMMMITMGHDMIANMLIDYSDKNDNSIVNQFNNYGHTAETLAIQNNYMNLAEKMTRKYKK
jgi:ankyrin repeat protein